MYYKIVLKKIIIIFIVEFFFCAQVQASGIISDPEAAIAERPQITQTSTGIPAVHITAPSSGGISKNKFSEYNVSQSGLVLNNSLTGGNTRLGGSLSANPNFSGTSAKVILNEVTGLNQTSLEGTTEVFGDKANLIVANPNGISVNGAEFINTPRVTLTTGTSYFENDKLKFDINGGAITVGRNGIGTAAAIDQLDFVARELAINGEIRSKESLAILVGLNAYGYESGDVSKKTGDPLDKSFAVDGSVFGMMNASKVMVICTEAGAGVKMAGSLGATSDNFTIDADGEVIIGNVQAGGDIDIATSGNVEKDGVSSSGGSTKITGKDILNKGSIDAGENIEITSSGNVENEAEMISGKETILKSAGEIKNKSFIGAFKKASVEAEKFTQENGILASKENIDITCGSFEQSNGSVVSGAGDVTISGSVKNTASSIASGGDVAVFVETPNLGVSTGIDNTQGSITAVGSLTIKTDGAVINDAGEMVANGDINIESSLRGASPLVASDAAISGISNISGIIQTGKSLTITSGAVDNSNGIILSEEKLLINAAGVVNVKGVISGNSDVFVETSNLGVSTGIDNTQGSIIAVGNLTLTSDGAVINDAGDMIANGNVNVESKDVSNVLGEVQSGKAVTITTSGLDNTTGIVLSEEVLTINSDEVKNVKGVICGNGDVFVETSNLGVSTGIDNTQGSITSIGSLTITTDSEVINDAGEIVANGDINIESSLRGASPLVASDAAISGISNISGIIQTGKSLTITSGAVDNSEGIILSEEKLLINATGVKNVKGVISGNQDVFVETPKLGVSTGIDNTQGSITAVGSLTIKTDGAVINDAGDMIADGEITIVTSTVSLPADAGNPGVEDTGLSAFADNDVLSNVGGVIQTGKSLTITSGAVDNSEGIILSQEKLLINATGVKNVKGVISGNQDVFVETPKLGVSTGIDNFQGIISSAKNIIINISGEFLNSLGSIVAGEDVIINSGALNNTAGEIIGYGDVKMSMVHSPLSMAGGINNVSGYIGSGEKLTLITTGNFDNTSGVLVSEGILDLTSQGFKNTNGFVIGNSDVNFTLQKSPVSPLSGGNIDNTNGSITAVGNLTLTSDGAVINDEGEMVANGNITIVETPKLGVSTELSNVAGVIQTGKSLTITTGAIDNSEGSISSAGAVNLTSPGNLKNINGTIESGGDNTINFYEIDNTSGIVNSGGKLAIVVGNLLDNTSGELASEGNLDVTIGKKFLNTNGEMKTNGVMNLHVTNSTVDNRNGVLSGATLILNSNGIFYNQNGEINADYLDLSSVNDFYNDAGTIHSNGNLKITAGENFHNANGNVLGIGDVAIIAGKGFDNLNGSVKSNRNVNINVGESLTQSGIISSGAALTINAQGMTNTSTTEAQTSLNITTTQDLTNTSGKIISNGSLNINTRNFTNESRISSQGSMNISAANITNYSEILSGGNATITSNADIINNNVIASAGSLALQATDITNNQASIYSIGDMSLSATDELLNYCGEISSEGNMVISANKIINMSQAYTAITDVFKSYGVEIYNLANNQDQTVLLNY